MNNYIKGLTKQHIKYSLFILLTAMSYVAFEAKSAVYQYSVYFNESLTEAKISLCVDGQQDDYLEIDRFKSYDSLLSQPVVNGERVDIEGRFWNIKTLEKDECLSYRYSFKNSLLKSKSSIQARSRLTRKDKTILHLEDNSWLWLPEYRDAKDQILVHFNLPEKYQVSTPWKKLDRIKPIYQLGIEPQEWGYHLIIGEIEVHHLEVEAQKYLNTAVINNNSKSQTTNKMINQWLLNIARSLKRYLGQFPLSQTQLIVYTTPGVKKSPVPWGEISRGNGSSILFVVRPEHRIKDFYADWTASHEFSHLLLPKIRYEDIWLSEGLASYLEYILMGQNKQISQLEAWQRIYKGLIKGKKGTLATRPEKLTEVANNRQKGNRKGRTMRLYWSGAAYFLKADIALREMSHGKIGLNEVLLKFTECCLGGKKEWHGDELAFKLDQLADTDIFSSLYEQIAYSKEFPSFAQDFVKLGFKVSRDLILKDGQSAVHINGLSLADVIMQLN